LSLKLTTFFRSLSPFVSILFMAIMIAFPVIFFCGGFLVPVLSYNQLDNVARLFFVSFMTQLLHECCFSWPANVPTTRKQLQAHAFIAPYDCLALLDQCLPRFMRRKQPENDEQLWQVGKRQERLKGYRTPLYKRLFSVLFQTPGWTHLLLIVGLLASLEYSLYQSINPYAHHMRNLHHTGLLILLTVGWPGLLFVDILFGSLTPFIYALAPPSVPGRESLVHREPITSVAHPLMYRHQRPFHVRRFGEAFAYFLNAAYVIAVFVLTFVHISN